MSDQLYSFLMRALLTEEALKSTQARVQSISGGAAEELRRHLSTDLLEQEFVLPARMMAEVYTAITGFERSVRDLVRGVLQDKFGDRWWIEGVSDRVRSRVEVKERDELRFRWHSSRGGDHLEYTDLGDLGSIIAQNWDSFEPYLHSETWTKNVFDVLEKSRNVIMHSGELEEHDIIRIGVFLRDWVRQVG